MTVPPSLLIVLEVLRPCFSAPSFATMSALVSGALSTSGARTATGMWQAAGLAASSYCAISMTAPPRAGTASGAATAS